MHFDFAAILVIAALVTGVIWLLDATLLAPRRERVYQGQGGGVGAATEAPSIPWYVDYSRSLFPVILAVLVLRSFIVEPFRIPSGSMEPTLYAGDFILVNKFSFGVRLPVVNIKILDSGQPERGDVAVFRYPEDPSVAYIKRIVGLPGDRITYRNKQLYINGKPIAQEDLPDRMARGYYDIRQEQLGQREHLIQVRPGREPVWERVVPPGHYFAMGDNRDNSRDSRVWGPLPEENLIGQAFLIWMNLDCITFKGHCGRIGDSIQ
ncbi:MAG: signal peptidase I [Candidatus Competibacteraceae bacterium]|nr:signal peptidase I [Candidatus Competibacteraceae bacterium]